MKVVEPRHDSDCVAACLASLLELPIEGMPDFWSAKSQTEAVRLWAAARGFHWYYSVYGGTDCPPLRDFCAAVRTSKTDTFPPRGFWLAQISSVDRLRDRKANHMVVMRDRRVVFSPGTTREALDGPWFLIGYYLLVPLDPALVPKGVT